MPLLADVQLRLRDTMLGGSADPVLPLLSGGRMAATRLAIHQRHYQTSLVDALLGKFPACAWLLGTHVVSDAARAFVRCHPPTAPCIAEYGELFPQFLASHAEAQLLPWVYSLAILEWDLGHVAIAVDASPIGREALAAIDVERLPEAQLTLQPGARYLELDWPVDELMKLFLSDSEPERFHTEPELVCIELRGARGTFHITRFGRATFTFRSSLAEGSSVGAAAEEALDVNPEFDVGGALVALIAENLAVAVNLPREGASHDH
jgi:hypothetical protein